MNVQAIFRYWLWLLLAAVVLQIAFAGFGAFDVVGQAGSKEHPSTRSGYDDSWGLHIASAT